MPVPKKPIIWKQRFPRGLHPEFLWSSIGIVFAVFIIFCTTFIALHVARIPYFALSPGVLLSIKQSITITENETVRVFPNPKGEFSLVTIRATGRLSPLDWISSKLSNDTRLFHIKELEKNAPKTPEDRRRAGQIQIIRSQNTAVVLAADVVGIEIERIPQGLHIFTIEECADAYKSLQANDVIVGIEGSEALSNAQLLEALSKKSAGDEVTLKITRNFETLDVSVKLGARNDSCLSQLFSPNSPSTDNQAAIGVSIDQLIEIHVPFEVDFSVGDIGGPSAGLAFTLGLIDLLEPGDLTGNKRIAATGVIQSDGRVTRIGGLLEKTIAVEKQGYDIFFVPKEQIGSVKSNSVKIIGVESIWEALAKLEAMGGDPLDRYGDTNQKV